MHRLASRAVPVLLILLVLVTVGCQRPEHRPGTVQRIGGPSTGSVSASASGVSGPAPAVTRQAGAAAAPTAGPTPGDGVYTPLGNVDIYVPLALDLQDISQLTNAVNDGRPLPAAEILTIYEQGKNARVGTATRMLRTFARAENRAREFPEAAQFHSSPSFLDDPVIEAINGTGSAANYTPAQRRQAIQKGIQRVLAYWMLQELGAAETRVRDGSIDPVAGAPHNVDEAWAIYMGPLQGTSYPASLAGTAVSREMNFRRDGMVDRPVREALLRAQRAAVAGNLADFQAARHEVEARLNTVFYLSAARYLNEALRAAQGGNAANAAASQTEGYSYYQIIQPTVARADPDADRMITAYYRADPATLTANGRDQALAALNRAADALGLRPTDRVSPADYQ